MLQTHLQYSAWASARLIDACRELTPEELTRDFGTADRSVLGTLAHVFAADRIWIGRIEGNPPAVFLDPAADMHLPVIQREWPDIHQRWQSAVTARTPEQIISYRDMKGTAYESPLQEIVFHVVNHATHHRGQIAGFLRALGHAPPPLDLIRYYRGTR